MAYPLKMLLQADGHLTSTDLLHTVAGAILFDVYENQDARLVALHLPERVVRTFPGPAHGPQGLRARTRFTGKSTGSSYPRRSTAPVSRHCSIRPPRCR